jgi:DNA-binding XRE family transcriptional regulator
MVRTAPLYHWGEVCQSVRHGLRPRNTRSELAALAGITPQALRNIETGRSEPRPPTALALASALDIDVSDLWTVGERAA